ncbi:transposase-like zinc-binding domain-containing protein [Okeania hirsuta]
MENAVKSKVSQGKLKTIHCPKCLSSRLKKKGFRRGKQCHQCQNCGQQDC